ncbi:BTAD domain-containing putative transcriptional regulator [Nocardia tengchongensis]|uniref:AfsR/SARP family transcriptional regulator n=1 Tax=Nocardia tengchongensis TaxID=2055889 RepID=UPI003692A416
MAMRVEFLGPFTASIDGIDITPSAHKPCQILALLALKPGQTVSIQNCIDELWGINPPARAVATLHSYIHMLRRRVKEALPDEHPWTAKDYLATSRGGYTLHLLGGSTDVLDLQRLDRESGLTLHGGEIELACATLREGLSLRRGRFLADLRLGAVLEFEGQVIEGYLQAILAKRINLDMRLHRHHDVLWELRRMLLADPLNESLVAQLMTSLYQIGQVAGALGEYARLRMALVAELGVEPTERLKRLQNAILDGRALDDSLLPTEMTKLSSSQ